jgi:hypothetical protein
MHMLRFPKRRTPWLTARCLSFNTLKEAILKMHLTADDGVARL